MRSSPTRRAATQVAGKSSSALPCVAGWERSSTLAPALVRSKRSGSHLCLLAWKPADHWVKKTSAPDNRAPSLFSSDLARSRERSAPPGHEIGALKAALDITIA